MRCPPDAALTAVVYGPNGDKVAEATLDAAGHGQARLAGAPALWSPDTPNLYRVETSLRAGGQVQDSYSDTCGFRTVEARDGRIYLNGEPIYLRGVLDQAYYPETIYTVPSVEFLEDQARKAKALGLNCLRIHIKIEDPRYYEVADRLGLLVWTEIPNWVLLTPATDRRAKATFDGMIERDGNHPSIIAWTLINENWGTDLSRNPEHRAWLIDFYHAAKQIDPTRLIVDNSACRDECPRRRRSRGLSSLQGDPRPRRRMGRVGRRVCRPQQPVDLVCRLSRQAPPRPAPDCLRVWQLGPAGSRFAQGTRRRSVVVPDRARMGRRHRPSPRHAPAL